MNSLERVLSTFNKLPVDRIAVNHRSFSSRSASHILGREAFVGGGIQQYREAKAHFEGWHDEFLERSFQDAMRLAEITEQDICRTAYWRLDEAPTRKIDEHTFLFENGPEESGRILKYNPETEQTTISCLKPRVYDMDFVRGEVDRARKQAKNHKPAEKNFLFQLKAQKACGAEKAIEAPGIGVGLPKREECSIWLEALALDPGLVRAYLEACVEAAGKNVDFLAGLGFTYFMGGGDIASEKGPLFSPGTFREVFLPAVVKGSGICRRNNVFNLFASDGNLWPIAEDLFGRSGIDGFFEIDRRAGMDIVRLRKTFPSLTLLGGINSWTLSRGSPADIEEEVRSAAAAANEYGGIIIGISNACTPETPPENIDALLEAVSRHRRA